MMNKLKSLVRYSVMGGVIAVSLGLTQQAQAAIGQCEPASGSPMNYKFSFDRLFESPDKNSGGQVFENVTENQTWQGGEYYNVNCDCGSATEMRESYITALPTGTLQATINGRNFYSLTGSSDFAAAAEVFVGGTTGKYFAVPFPGPISNGLTGRRQLCKGAEYESGSKGFVHLYFLQPVIGTSKIDPSILTKVYINSTSSAATGNPTAIVTMSGTITVPQKCELKDSVITVPFGIITSSAFKNKGQIPNGISPQEKTLYLECSNLSTRAKISLLFEGGANPHDLTALKTTTTNGSVTADNDDIAIRIEEKRDGGGTQVISPGDKLSMNMNGLGNVDSDSKATLIIYPISATGIPPKVGDFEATATITVKME